MKRLTIKLELLFVIAGLMLSINAHSQVLLKETSKKGIESGSASIDINFPRYSTIFGNRYSISTAFFNAQLDMNLIQSDFLYGGDNTQEVFEFELTFAIKAYDESNNVISTFGNEVFALKINNKQPLKVLKIDLTKVFSSVQSLNSIKKIVIENPTISNGNVNLYNNVRTFATIDVEYCHDVEDNNNNAIVKPTIRNAWVFGNTVVLDWKLYYPYKTYQLQLLHLMNNDPTYKSNDSISAFIDWKKSLTFEIPINNSIDINGNLNPYYTTRITVSEGDGYYLWRVRPIGTYYEGGIANSKNYGPWSSDTTGNVKLFKYKLDRKTFFYYNDRDQGVNRIYNRVFSEENKTKELTTYANYLNQVRQTQTYLPSNNVTIVSQTAIDNSGRPVISTLPMPTEGKESKYITKYMTHKGNVYTAKNFDVDSISGIPFEADLVDEDRDMNYYSSNPDPRIPDSDSVAFMQTRYYNDPLNRVKEEGGPGRMQLIKNSGAGKNTKFFYGTPSKTELVKLFGKEAPDHQTVSKMYKVDANNIATITYTSSEGKVLASCISFLDAGDGSLEAIKDVETSSIKDEVTNNMAFKWGFLSSKRIVLLQKTNVNISYSIEKARLDVGCTSVDVDCNYSLDIIIHSADGKGKIQIYKDYPIKGTKDQQIITVPSVNKELPIGTWIIEKRLKLGSPEMMKGDASNSMYSKITPIVNLISQRLDSVKCPDQVIAFQLWLKGLASLFGSINIIDSKYYSGAFKDFLDSDVYTDHLVDYNIYLKKYDGKLRKYVDLPSNSTDNADLALIITPCCQIPFPVKWIRKFNSNVKPTISDANGDGKIEPINVNLADSLKLPYDFIPDFEGYAMASFDDCPILSGDKFYQLMDGWGGITYNSTTKVFDRTDNIPRGTFNLMVYHMLTDTLKKYTINPIEQQAVEEGNSVSTPKPDFEVDECGNVVSTKWMNGVYTPVGLFNCWQNQINDVRAKFGCDDYEIDGTSQNNSKDVGNEIDKSSGDAEELNQSLKKVLKKVPFWKRRKVKNKIIRKVRNKSAAMSKSSKTNPVSNIAAINMAHGFLECTGYTFVKILTPYNEMPNPEDAIPANVQGSFFTPVNYNINKTSWGILGRNGRMKYSLPWGVFSYNYFNSSTYKKANQYDYYYYPLADWSPKLRKITGEVTDTLFAHIKNPIYAFKYFEYPGEGKIRYQELEYNTCYSDPNECYTKDNQGFVAKAEQGGFKTVPCCMRKIGNDKYFDKCYNDTLYPNLNTLIPRENEDLFLTLENGKRAKRIVNDFEGSGRIRCPYDHYSWSSGQRKTFYNALVNYKFVSEDEDNEDEGEYDDNLFTDCASYERPYEWYQDIFHPDSVVTKDERIITSPESKRPYKEIILRNKKQFSYIELEMDSLSIKCNKSCEERRDEIRRRLMEMLTQNCYDVGGCRGVGEEFNNVVPYEDLELMVDTIVGSCKSQCKVNTYGCTELETRYIRMPKYILGYAEASKPRLLIGLGGYPYGDKDVCGKEIKLYNDAKSENITYNAALNAYRIIVDKNADILNEFSWYQHTLVNQATEWDFEMNLPSMCDSYTIQAEYANKVMGVVRTTLNVENFGKDDMLLFEGVDFGDSTLSLEIRYSVADIEDAGKNIQIMLDNNLVGNFVTKVTVDTIQNKVYDIQELQFSSRIQGIHDILIKGWDTNSIGKAKIDWIKLKSRIGSYSHIREFTGCRNGGVGDTFIERSAYELENKPLDENKPSIGAPVTSPVKNIILEINK